MAAEYQQSAVFVDTHCYHKMTMLCVRTLNPPKSVTHFLILQLQPRATAPGLESACALRDIQEACVKQVTVQSLSGQAENGV